MRSPTIEASNLEKARAISEALSAFQPRLVGSVGEGYAVTVALGGSDRQFVAVLDLLQEHVSTRRDGSAELELDGRTYMMYPN